MAQDALMKEKEEVQDFLKNLSIEYRFSCFSEKNNEGCQLLGDFFTQIDGDFVKANKVFKDNCDIRNYGRSCASYGLHLLYGRGCEKNYQSALEYFVKACDNDDATGCDFAGKLLTGVEPALRNHIKPDLKRGLRYLEHGCNLKSSAQMFESSESCYAAAFFYAAGVKDIGGKNPEKAITLGTRSCEMGQMRACKLVSDVYTDQGNQELASQFYKRYKMFEKQMKDQVQIEMGRT